MVVWYNEIKRGDERMAAFAFITLLYSAIISATANSFTFMKQMPQSLFLIIPVFLLANIFSGIVFAKTDSKKLKTCYHGTILLSSFCLSMIISAVYQIWFAFKTIPNDYRAFIWSMVLCIGVHAIVFWNGIICVYLTSAQLGVKMRFIGILCGMIPIANLIALFFIIKTTIKECLFEFKKEKTNHQRK